MYISLAASTHLRPRTQVCGLEGQRLKAFHVRQKN